MPPSRHAYARLRRRIATIKYNILRVTPQVIKLANIYYAHFRLSLPKLPAAKARKVAVRAEHDIKGIRRRICRALAAERTGR